MAIRSVFPPSQTVEQNAFTSKGQIDLLVLRYMAQNILTTLHSVEQQPIAQPVFATTVVGSRRSYEQRIIFYNPQALLLNPTLSFVSFVGERHKILDEGITDEVHQVDALLAKEFMTMPGLLGYSTLQIRPDCSYNLVLFADAADKGHLKSSVNHSYAAYQLAPRYYEWIRLHSGTLPGGLLDKTLQLQWTKYFNFQSATHNFTIVEQTY